MKKYEEPLDPEALLLDRYLKQYKRCIRRKHVLERRRDEIIKEFDNPLSGVSYDVASSSGGESLGCAALSFRLDEINTKINEQMDKSVKVLAEIMDIIDFLPENSMERSIIEHRYIDRLSWWQICKEENISRTPATNYWKKGLYDLLGFKRVRKILEEYEKGLEDI